MTRRGLTLTLLALLVGVAQAHPVDEVVQGAYLTLLPGAVELELDLTPGSKVSAGMLKTLDASGDQTVSAAEAQAYGKTVLAQSTLTLDGVAVKWTLDHVTVPVYQNLALGNETFKVYGTAKRADTAGTHVLGYVNRFQPAKSQCIANIFLQPGSWTYTVHSQTHSNDGRGLTVTYAVARP